MFPASPKSPTVPLHNQTTRLNGNGPYQVRKNDGCQMKGWNWKPGQGTKIMWLRSRGGNSEGCKNCCCWPVCKSTFGWNKKLV